MNPFLARELLSLADCECCEGTGIQTPVAIDNRAGLRTFAYRVGTYRHFKQSLLAQLASARLPALQALTTRDDDDFAIALLDAWAIVADVLTFYQERIAHESYLNTATERLSLRHLARLIGYPLQPGVAASTPLAFTVDETPGSPTQVRIDAGTKVQSIPGQDEHAQLFETIEPVQAQVAWNALRPRRYQPHTADLAKESVITHGVGNNIRRGDKILIVEKPTSPNSPSVKTVLHVEVDQTAQTTRLDFVDEKSPDLAVYNEPTNAVEPPPTGQIPLNRINITETVLERTWTQRDLQAFAKQQGWSIAALAENVAQQLAQLNQPVEVFVFRISASLFGYNAADRILYTDGSPNTLEGFLQTEPWPLDESDNRLFLDNAYAAVTDGSYIAIQTSQSDKANILAYQVEAASVGSRTAYGISGKTTKITLSPPGSKPGWVSPTDFDMIRETVVFAGSEKLSLAPLPILQPVAGNIITLDGFYLGLQPGQLAILTGAPQELPGTTQSEVITIHQVTIHQGYTRLTLQNNLKQAYRRDTVTINANVAIATHGETTQEILGSGDASQSNQTFTLRQPPLTYISSDAAPQGALTTLQVRVDNVRWHEVPSLYQQPPRDRIYCTQQNEDGTTTLTFGDGRTGRRLPTGQENVHATYRKGIGLAGNVRARQLSLLMSRPLGLKDVTNPLPALGGDDPETVDAVRQNAPLTVLTLDRVVSLQDYEDFARTFAGVAKSLATWTWMGQLRGVFLTVARPQGAEVSPNLIANLIRQIKQSGDPHVPLQVQSYRQALFQIAGRIRVHADYSSQAVLTAVKQALLQAFSFELRQFGQGVTLSEVMAVMQPVPGVTAVDIDRLARNDLPLDGTQVPLPAATPQPGETETLAAELLTIDPASLEELGVMG